MRRLLLPIFVALLLAGCQSENTMDFNKHSKLFVKERTDDAEEVDDFKTLKVIEDTSEVDGFVKTFDGFDWDTNGDVDFEDFPDYLLNDYGVWLSPETNRLEIKNLENSDYAPLNEKQSSELFYMLTGEELQAE